jgi:hypothetical protein
MLQKVWRELVQQFLGAQPAEGAPTQDLQAAEAELGIGLPGELRELLSETDGVVGEYGLNLVWPLRRLVSDNLAFRSNEDFRELYMPFDPLLFFGDAGNGDQFAYVVLAGQVRSLDIFAWDHENDSRYWVVPTLRHFIEWWGSGRIRL